MPQRAGSRLCRGVFWSFVALYLAAFALFVIGRYGLFGSPSGPLAGVFLVPLGLPWNLMIDAAPEPARIWLAILAPGVNAGVLAMACRVIARR